MTSDSLADSEETRKQQYIDLRKALGYPPALSIHAGDYSHEIQNKLNELHELERAVAHRALVPGQKHIVWASDYLRCFSVMTKEKDLTSLSDRLDVALDMARWMRANQFTLIVFDEFTNVACDGILFIGNVLLEAQARKAVDFPNAYFSGDITLDQSSLEEIDLSFAEIKGEFHMEANRVGETNFEGTVFHTKADFHSREFARKTNFHGTWFLAGGDFRQAKFLTMAVFHKTYFTWYAKFERTEFWQIANFSEATFKGRADFSKALFKDWGDFRNVSFRDQVDFSDATFTLDVYFDRAKFYDDAIFDRINFNDREDEHISFAQAEFFNAASFKETKFSKVAFFHKAKFMGHTDFESAHFRRIAEFGSATFQGTCSFFKSQFWSSLNVHNTHFHRRADFQQTTFEYLPDFRYVKFDADTDLRAAKIERQYVTASSDGKGTETTSIVEIIRHQKSLAINAHDHRGALDRGANELRAEYIEFAEKPEESPKLNWRGRLFALLRAIPAAMYFAIASNGRSFWRPLAWAFVTTGAMALVYAGYDNAWLIRIYVLSFVGYVLGMAYGYGRLKISDDDMQQNALFGLFWIVVVTLALLFDSWNSTAISDSLHLAGLISANPLRVFALILQGDDLFENGMFDSSTILAANQFVVQAHATVSLALLFLIGLALRNIFKIG